MSKNWDYLFDPPNLHEICFCENCHEAEAHDAIEHWVDEGCSKCETKLAWAIKEGEYCADCKIWYCEDHVK